MTRIMIVGNCQGQALARLIEALADDVVATAVIPNAHGLARLAEGGFDGEIARSDLVLLQPGGFQRLNGTGAGTFQTHAHSDDPSDVVARHLDARFPDIARRAFPKIYFSAFHPDIDVVRVDGGAPLHGPMGHHSSIAFYGWQQGLTVSETTDLFTEHVFTHLGFFDYWDASTAFLINEGRQADLPLDSLMARWTARGVWMYQFNHPRLHVLADVARAVLAREGIASRDDDEQRVEDVLALQAVFPVYPEVGTRIGVVGSYRFTPPSESAGSRRSRGEMSLHEFVSASFDVYSAYERHRLVCQRLASARYKSLNRLVGRRPSAGSSSGAHNPYDGLPDYQFWRRAIAQVPAAEVDPVIRSAVTLRRTDKVATAGSCFAQHLSRSLSQSGFTYYVAEKGGDLPTADALRRGYGQFSARYGNIYTARQLVQLFERAYGAFDTHDRSWRRDDGRLVDPFRPNVEPDGFATLADVERSRDQHLAAVREMLENLDVFVFTLGLTEAWRSRIDGAVFPLAPGVVAGTFVPEGYEFVNFTAADVLADLKAVMAKLLAVNPTARMLLTVSPVPLIATYEDRHVLVSTTYSKSVLRVAAEECCASHPMCEYFPSYEIITGPHARGRYFDDDARSVTAEGVAHVMRVFLAHYSSASVAPSFAADLLAEQASMSAIVCDEEALVPTGPLS